MFLYKNLFFDIFYFFNPNYAYWNQRRLFSGNLPGMFLFLFQSQSASSGSTPAIFRQSVGYVFIDNIKQLPEHGMVLLNDDVKAAFENFV